MLLEQFDHGGAVLNPCDLVKPVKNFPKLCIGSFSQKITEKLLERQDVKKIAALTPSFGENPIFQTVYKGTPIAFYTSFPGAAACICGMEDVFAMGAEVLLFLGSCGVLDRSLQPGSILIPQTAVRDEGTSYHYQEASDEIDLDSISVETIELCARHMEIPCARVKTWTTDALYRETRAKVERRKAQGCRTVDMECSALAAASRFRGAVFGEFFYAADNLDAVLWEERGLRGHGASKAEAYAALALESVWEIAQRRIKQE